MQKQGEVIVILGGGLAKNPNGSFRTANFNEQGDRSGVCGGRLRVEAANYLYRKNLKRIIIASGGQGLFEDLGEHPNISKVIKEELIDLGVSAQKIIEEANSNNTYQQLKELKKIFKENEFKKAIVITNKWHIPRTRMMLKYKDDLKELKKLAKVKLLSAEKVVLKHDKNRWQKIVDDAYKSEAIKQRVKLEKKGIKHIKEGTYNYG